MCPFWCMDHHGRDCLVLDLQLPVHSVPNTTSIVNSSPARSKVYLVFYG
jgi:hypothetical protein